MPKKKVIVISAINIRNGGAMSVLKDCFNVLNEKFANFYEIWALVHKKELLKEFNNINFIEYPNSIKSYFLRCYYEYFDFYRISKMLKPYLWLSLHDITPNVKADIRAVYCHNPSPFYKIQSFNNMLEDLNFTLFTWFYKYLYKININKNNYIIVQQSWLRNEFCKMFNLKKEKIIVAYPHVKYSKTQQSLKKENESNIFTSFYPSFPRVFKNFEIICEAAKKLNDNGDNQFRFILTIDGTENKYSKTIVEKYKNFKNIEFVGLQSRDKVYELYQTSNVLIFPSNLETWGLPITEAKAYNIPIIAADLPYAHETVGDYDKVNYFNPSSSEDLVEKLIDTKNNIYKKSKFAIPKSPYVDTWGKLLEMLLAEGK